MNFTSSARIFQFGDKQITVLVPDAGWMQQDYLERKHKDSSLVFPYWSQVWPAAMGLCNFLAAHTFYIENKKVTELAAGLGLPSLLAAAYASEVHGSDYIPEAVEMMQLSAQENGYSNMQFNVADWNHLPEDQYPDVLLLSDINYEPAAFDQLHYMLIQFLQAGTTILLSTPQRLMAKSFIGRLLPFCVEQEEYSISMDQYEEPVLVSVLVLKSL
jgi:predicted nicotinamide N-methyase